MPTIKGKITDQYGQPAARIVRLYRRDTGAYLGETSSAAGVNNYGDPHYDKVSLLLPMEGADGSTVFTDYSVPRKVVTAHGTARVSTTQSKWGGGSLLLGGAGDYLSAPADAAYTFGTGDFTVEAWIKTTTPSEKVLVDQYLTNAPSWQLSIQGGRLSWYERSNSLAGGYSLVGTKTVNDGAWRHVAATRAASVLRFFVDGVQDGSASLVTNYSATAPLGVGAQVATRNPTYDLPGGLAGVRITRGVARYTAIFQPPTAPHPATQNDQQNALGEYYLSTPYTGEVQRIVLDSRTLGDPTKLNDLVDRVFLI